MNIKKTCVLFVFFVCWATAISHSSGSEQTNDDRIRERLQGTWEIDFRKTAELLSTLDAFEEPPDPQMISMLAPRLLNFSEDGVRVGEYSSNLPAKFRVGESEEQILVDLVDESRRFTLQLNVVDENSIQLLAPTTVLGPLVFAFRQDKRGVAPSPENLLAKLEGSWSLNWELSQALWDQLKPAEAVKNYLSVIRPQLANMTTLRIEGNSFYYEPGETVEPFMIELQDESNIFLRGSLSREFRAEINIISENLIQLADERRRVFAIFERRDHAAQPMAEPTDFPPNQLANFVSFYVVDSRPRLPDRGPPIGIDGQVHIERLDISRVRAAEAVQNADITNMRVELFLNLKAFHQSMENSHLVRLVELSDIRDDSGKLLLTERRRKRVDMLHRPIKPRSFMNKPGGGQGPVVEFVIDAPATGAISLVELAGEFEVAPYSTRLIVFRDLRSHVGKELSHPLLPDLTFKPMIKDDRFPELRLEGIPTREDRINYWSVTSEDGLPINPTSWGGNNHSQGFNQPLPDKFDLWMEVLEVGPSQRIKFKFENIVLP